MSWSVPPVWYTLQAFGVDSSVFGPWLDGWYGLLSDTAALSILAIVRRPAHPHLPLERWLPTLRPAPGALRPTLLVLDGVIKPENVGALFRTALAFGVCGVVLSPGCADPLYRKAIRASMGGCFKL